MFTSVERIGIKKGIQQGRRDGLIEAIKSAGNPSNPSNPSNPTNPSNPFPLTGEILCLQQQILKSATAFFQDPYLSSHSVLSLSFFFLPYG